VLDALGSELVYYRNPSIRDYQNQRIAVVGGGDSALDAALMALGRGGSVELIVREGAPAGKADTLNRIREAGASFRRQQRFTRPR
jgi:thioredoxin reductase